MKTYIKEIAIQAQLEHCVSHVRLEKFAELIVRECVDELMILHKAACDSHNYYHYAANKIKEHFGVEE